MTILDIRKMTKLSRAEFCRRYNLPLRSVEDWEAGAHSPANYLSDLLERAVREDFNLPRIYYVTLTRGDDENCLFKTANKAEAIRRAQDEAYYIERDKRPRDVVEVRLYLEDIEDPECDCFDYDTVDL